MRILISVNNVKTIEKINYALTSNGFSTDCVKTGAETIEYLETGIYDALVISSATPEPNGLNILSIIRKDNELLPIFILCPKETPMDVVKALNHGANDSITYPFYAEEFVARLRCMTNDKKVSIPTKKELSYGDIILNRISNELIINGRSLRLTNKEFQIIEMLMLNPEIPITTEKFMSKIWGYESESDSGYSVVWSTITNLRHKLKTLNSNVIIELRRNVGYILKEK